MLKYLQIIFKIIFKNIGRIYVNFLQKIFRKKYWKFIEDIRKASKNLDKENQKFIEDIFLEKKDGTKYTYYASYLRATLKQVLLSKKDVKLNDIFPKNIYPAMELLVGKKFLKIFLEISKNATKYSFSRGYSRRMVRSSSYYNYIDFFIWLIYWFSWFKFSKSWYSYYCKRRIW